MIELKRILFATDFSECATRAKLMAHEMAARFGAEMHCLHVIHDLAVEVPEFGMGLSFPGYVENVGAQRNQLRENALKALESEVGASWRTEHPVVLATRIGKPFVEIIRYARDNDVDLIVLGSHGRTGLSHVLLGSVAEKVVRKAQRPVLTVRRDSNHQCPETDDRDLRAGIHPLPVGR